MVKKLIDCRRIVSRKSVLLNFTGNKDEEGESEKEGKLISVKNTGFFPLAGELVHRLSYRARYFIIKKRYGEFCVFFVFFLFLGHKREGNNSYRIKRCPFAW